LPHRHWCAFSYERRGSRGGGNALNENCAGAIELKLQTALEQRASGGGGAETEQEISGGSCGHGVRPTDPVIDAGTVAAFITDAMGSISGGRGAVRSSKIRTTSSSG
jgi:hypothetical protein